MRNSDNQITSKSIENYLHESRLKMGQNIREIREKRGYSQDELAEIMEVNRSTISKKKMVNLVLVLIFLILFF
jgi:DNA-binding XRE family transcriptional regulator